MKNDDFEITPAIRAYLARFDELLRAVTVTDARAARQRMTRALDYVFAENGMPRIQDVRRRAARESNRECYEDRAA